MCIAHTPSRFTLIRHDLSHESRTTSSLWHVPLPAYAEIQHPLDAMSSVSVRTFLITSQWDARHCLGKHVQYTWIEHKNQYSEPNFMINRFSMRTLLLIVLVVSGLLFCWSVLLMTPKGWLWAWIAGVWGSSDYGSKKSVENTLKRVAIVTSILFVVVCIALPYTVE